MKVAFVFVVVAVLACRCALAKSDDYYQYTPAWSCEWTLKQEWISEDGLVRERETNVNGVFLRDKLVFKEGEITSFSDRLYRVDLSNDSDNLVKVFSHAGGFQVEDAFLYSYSDLEFMSMKEFQSFLSMPFGVAFTKDVGYFCSWYFAEVEETTCDGKRCKKYHTSDESVVLFTDIDGLPINASYHIDKEGQWNGVFHLTREAPLSRFKFKTDAVFGDVRVYKNPQYSLCDEDDD